MTTTIEKMHAASPLVDDFIRQKGMLVSAQTYATLCELAAFVVANAVPAQSKKVTAGLLTLRHAGYTYSEDSLAWTKQDDPVFKLRPYQQLAVDALCETLGITLQAGTSDAPDPNAKCWCEVCWPPRRLRDRMIVCPECSNKRCPRANWHGYKCTGSNDVGQKGEPE